MANIIRENFISFVPRDMRTNWIVEIDGTDRSDDVLDIEFTMAVTNEIGDCSIKLNNNDNTYTGLYSGGETIKIYLDFADASTKKFEGYVNKIEKDFGDEGNIIKLKGKQIATTLMDITVTESYTDQEVSTILTDIISTYATGYTDTNVNTTTVNHTTNWNNKPFWDCVIELCHKAGFDCYVDNDKDFHFFEKNSILNTTEAIMDQNCLGIEGLGTDTIDVKNIVIVYGEDDDGGQIIYKAEDSDSQTTYNPKERLIEDSRIKTYNQAKDIGDAELERLKSPDTTGKAEAFILPDLNPGDRIWISYPELQIHDKYRIVRFTTKIFENSTTVFIEKVQKIPEVLRDRISKETELERSKNPEKMEHSFNFVFNDDSEIDVFQNIETFQGKLKLTAGSTTGFAISVVRSSTTDITQCYLQHIGSALAGNVTYEGSVDNGINWETITPDTLHTFSSGGKKLKLRISITNSSTEIDNVSLGYK